MNVKIDGRDVTIEKDGTLGVAVECDGKKLRVPPFSHYTVVDGALFVITAGTAAGRETAFRIPSPERNLARIEPDCRLGWIVDDAADHRAESGGYAHERFHDLGRRLITEADTGRFFEIDTESGAIEDTWPGSAFVFGDTRVDLKYDVDHAAVIDGVRVLVANGEDFGSVVYGFDADGSKRWERGFSENLVQLRETSDGNAGLAKMRGGFALDPTTGDVV